MAKPPEAAELGEMPPPGTPLGTAAQIPDGGAREIVFGRGDEAVGIVLFRVGDSVTAYRNRCPHFHLPLNIRPDRFIMIRGGRVMCGWHSAVFSVADGVCVDGPCRGAGLVRIRVENKGGALRVACQTGQDP